MVAVNYLWNPINDNIIEEFDDAGNTIAEYTTEPDLYGNVVSQFRGGQTSYLLSDGQGNTTELTNDAGNVTDMVRYSAFGQVTQRTGSTEIPFQYVGQKGYYSENSSCRYFVRRRSLSPHTGRWYSVDPLPPKGQAGDFTYAMNSPLLYSDPSGEKIYAVDGTTWAWDDKRGKSNVQRLLERSQEGSAYWRGPKVGGEDSASLRDSVYTWICKDLCAMRDCGNSIDINMSGWSRGAVIVVAVAHLLNDRGCCCDNPRYNRAPSPPKCCPSRSPPSEKPEPCADLIAPPIGINWIGLFDAVGWMIMDLLEWPHSFPPNVATKLHVVHTGKAETIREALFVTWKTLTPIKDCWRFDGDPTTHNDVGTQLNNNAFYDICESAISAGVKLRDCKKRRHF